MSKEWRSKYNPFNSDKVLTQVYKWREIQDGFIPVPTTVSIDPMNACNYKCKGCNAAKLLAKNSKRLSSSIISELAEFLPNWGVEAVCVGGGGEPTLHPHIDTLIEEFTKNGLEVGIVTNGSQLAFHTEALTKCTWVGISVDAGTKRTYSRLKGKDYFGRICGYLCNLSKRAEGTKLGREGKGYGVFYKYLVHPENIEEITNAAWIAKHTGCQAIHIRPGGQAWFELDGNHFTFTDEDWKTFNEQIEEARELEDENFQVYGVTHKFDKLKPKHDFNKCWAVFMTFVIMPPRDDEHEFTLGLCCDRRGHPLLEKQMNDVADIFTFWGGLEHKQLQKKIDIEKCPRCTFTPHNKVFEEVILKDNMTYRFI